MVQKFHFAILRIEVTRASRGLSAITELLVQITKVTPKITFTRSENNSRISVRLIEGKYEAKLLLTS